MFSFFKKKIFLPKETPPQVGEEWFLKANDGSPWPLKKYKPVKILDVKDGWVRYAFQYGFPSFGDERLKVYIFMHVYQRESC